MKLTEIQHFQFTVDGYGYHEEEDFPTDEGEPSKKWHYMTTPTGEQITLDHSPYQWMSKEEFAGHVAKHKALSEESVGNDDAAKEAFLAGFDEGRRIGYDDGTGVGAGRYEETPEEAYEYWIKYDRK